MSSFSLTFFFRFSFCILHRSLWIWLQSYDFVNDEKANQPELLDEAFGMLRENMAENATVSCFLNSEWFVSTCWSVLDKVLSSKTSILIRKTISFLGNPHGGTIRWCYQCPEESLWATNEPTDWYGWSRSQWAWIIRTFTSTSKPNSWVQSQSGSERFNTKWHTGQGWANDRTFCFK